MKLIGHLKRLGIIESVRGRLVLYFLLLLVIPMSAFTYLQFSDEKEHVLSSFMKQLSSVADTRKRNIDSWINERVGDLSLLSGDILVQKSLNTLIGKGHIRSVELKADSEHVELENHLQNFARHIGYSRAELIDTGGRIVVSTHEDDTGRSVEGADYFVGALEAGPDKVYIKDVFLDGETGKPMMVFSRPVVYVSGGQARVIGVAALSYDLDNTFYPVILNWPGKGETGETLLVKREGGNVVFLNRLKHIDYEPTTFSIPVSRGRPLPAIFSSAGQEGALETTDYRGVDVIAAYRYIPATRWGLVAKIDKSEAFMAINHFRNWAFLFLFVFTLFVVVLIALLSKRIVEPIVALAANTRKIEKGDFTIALPEGGKDEIGELTQSFRHMAEALKVSNDEVAKKGEELENKNRMLEMLAESLETKVIERTRELEEMNRAQAEIMKRLDERTTALEKSRQELKDFAGQLEVSSNRARDNLEIVERANVELRRIDSMKDQFLGIISHELRTPLSLIMGYASNLLTNPGIVLDPSLEEEVEGIYKGAERLKEVISEMLDVSSIDARGLRLGFEKVDVGALVSEVIGELDPFIRERKQVMEVGEFSGVPEVPLDRKRMQQVLINIIGNAIKFTPDGGRIQISNRIHKMDPGLANKASGVFADHLDIVVRDTGIGLDKDEVEHIFEKFYEVGDIEKHATSKYRFLGRGIGLGLPIARGIVEAHGGWLWADSEGHDPVKCPGTSIHIMVPLRQPVTSAREARPPVAEAAPARAEVMAAHEKVMSGLKGTGRPSILIVEDDKDLIKLTEFVLKDRYELHKAMNGRDGIRLAREIMPDLILLDVYMEGMDGYEVCEILKGDPKTRGITLAMFTAGVQKWEMEKGYSSGADDYITKPFKPSELVAKVDELISGRMAVSNNSVD